MRSRARRARRVEIVITGGGTAGHVLPAIAVAQALCERGHDPKAIRFVGSRRGMEARLVAESGYSCTLLPGRGIVRSARPSNLVAIGGLVVAFIRATALLVRSRPRVVICVGGYAGLSCSLAASLLRVPIVVVSVDAVAGATNRIIARFAVQSAVAFDETALPRAILTGAPLRREVVALAEDPAAQARACATFDLGAGRRVVAVTGGSLGAWRLNQAALGVARALAARRDLVIYHVTGERDFERVQAMATSLGLSRSIALDYRVVAFEEHLPEIFAASDLVICRAGAMTVAEIAALGVASVLVPLPGAPGDHQRVNATSLSSVGAAVLLDDADADVETLLGIVEELLADPDRLAAMASAARRRAHLDATARIAGLVEDVAGSRPQRSGESRRGGVEEERPVRA